MRRVLTVFAGAVLALLPFGVAHAQDTGPGAVTCESATALAVAAQAEVDDLTADLAVEVAALDQARFLLANATESAKPYFTGEVARLDGAVAGLRVGLADATAALAVAVTGRDEVCAPPTETPTPTTTPTPSAPATPSVAPVGDLDCPDFPLSDGRTAQDVLDADPADPHILDGDADGIACDVDDEDGSFSQVGNVPVGSVATGG